MDGRRGGAVPLAGRRKGDRGRQRQRGSLGRNAAADHLPAVVLLMALARRLARGGRRPDRPHLPGLDSGRVGSGRGEALPPRLIQFGLDLNHSAGPSYVYSNQMQTGFVSKNCVKKKKDVNRVWAHVRLFIYFLSFIIKVQDYFFLSKRI